MTAETALSLLVISLGTFLAPITARRAGVPTAVGEILFGIAVGGAGLGIVSESDTIRFLADLGFIFLMFIAGLEIDFTSLERYRSETRRAAAAVALVFAASAALTAQIGSPVVVALLCAAFSIGVLVPILREARLLATPFGQALLVLGTIGEVFTLVAFAFYEAWAFHGWSVHLLSSLARLGLIAATAILLLRGLALLAWWAPDRFAPLASQEDPAELGIRGALALLFALVAVSALLHVELIIGAFLAGAVMRFVFRGVHSLEGKIAGTGFGFFVPVFFIHIGIGFDARALTAPATSLSALALLAAMIALRLLVVPALLPHGKRKAGAGILLLATPLTLLVAIAEVARRSGRIGADAEASIILSALLGALLLPPIARRLLLESRKGPESPPVSPRSRS